MANKLLSALLKGTYSAITAYTVGDIVDYLGGSYACKVNSTGNLPTNTTYWALLADKGDTGATGATGATGSTGAPGADGFDGVSAGLLYSFDTVTTDADPGAGKIRFNNATIASVTQLFLDNLENGGSEVSGFIDLWDDSTNTALRGTLKITKRGTETTFAVFNITGAVTDG